MRSLVLGISVFSIGVMLGQQDPPAGAPGDPNIDPPDRVARLNFITGNVAFQPGGVDDWVAAELNRPLTIGDHLWADNGGRAELHIGSTAIRLNASTGISFFNLEDHTVQIRLSEGSMSLRLRNLMDGEVYEVDTPNVAFTLLRPGEYRIDANPDGTATLITVRSGEGEATAGGQVFDVPARQQAQVNGTENVAYDLVAMPQRDPWDDWCNNRDAREDRSQSVRYVGREMPGYEDLDNNGVWTEQPEYGAVWTPRGVPADWAPYHDGHWVWVEPWGWTWVDDAPWGFAPFHYGRWVYVGGGWGWVPGPVVARPVYAPALVAWVGGSHFSLGISAGGPGIGWFPLGPREVYVPGYRASRVYVENINITNTRVDRVMVGNMYAHPERMTYINRGAPRAVAAVPMDALAGGRRVRDVAVIVPADRLRGAEIGRVAPVAPMRESVLGRAGGGRVAQPPAAVFARPVVARVTPAPRPVPFAIRQQSLQADPGHPLAPERMQQLRGNDAAYRPAIRPAMRGGQAPVTPNQYGRPTQQTPAYQQQQAPGYNRSTIPQNPSTAPNQNPGYQQQQRPGYNRPTIPPNGERTPDHQANPVYQQQQRPGYDRPTIPPNGERTPDHQANPVYQQQQRPAYNQPEAPPRGDATPAQQPRDHERYNRPVPQNQVNQPQPSNERYNRPTTVPQPEVRPQPRDVRPTTAPPSERVNRPAPVIEHRTQAPPQRENRGGEREHHEDKKTTK